MERNFNELGKENSGVLANFSLSLSLPFLALYARELKSISDADHYIRRGGGCCTTTVCSIRCVDSERSLGQLCGSCCFAKLGLCVCCCDSNTPLLCVHYSLAIFTWLTDVQFSVWVWTPATYFCLCGGRLLLSLPTTLLLLFLFPSPAHSIDWW